MKNTELASSNTFLLLLVIKIVLLSQDCFAGDNRSLSNGEKESAEIKCDVENSASSKGKEGTIKNSDCAEVASPSNGNKPSGVQKTSTVLGSGLYNINRFQLRYITEGGFSINQTSFVRSRSKFFMLADIEHTSKYDESRRFNRLEFDIGKTIDISPWGFVGRFQKLSGQEGVYGPGVQFTLTDMVSLRDWAARNRVSTFIQLFGLKNDHSVDLVHYYQFPIYQKLYARGTNNFMHLENRGRYWRWMTDFIYTVTPQFDSYLRFSYQNRNDVFYGTTGTTWALGARYNFSF